VGSATAGWRSSGRYLIARARQEEADRAAIIFPRYHQLDVTRKLQAAVLRRPRAAST
jgi:hypothetical protein